MDRINEMNRMIGAMCERITFSGDILFILSILSISDLVGTDAARKLELIARAAFVDATHIELHVCGIAGVTTVMRAGFVNAGYV